MKLTDNPDGSPRIGTHVISMSSPTLSSTANRHKESLFDIVEEASLTYYEGNTGLVNPQGRAINEADGSVTYLPGPKLGLRGFRPTTFIARMHTPMLF